MEKMKLFLDTSVISAYFDLEKGVRQLITQKWFENDAKDYSLYISEVVMEEIGNNTDHILEEKMLYIVNKYSMTVLKINDEINSLAQKYRNDVIPREVNDSLHIAVASVYELNAIISWNFRHIVNLKTINIIHQINIENNLKIIEILSPENIGGAKYGSLS